MVKVNDLSIYLKKLRKENSILNSNKEGKIVKIGADINENIS